MRISNKFDAEEFVREYKFYAEEFLPPVYNPKYYKY